MLRFSFLLTLVCLPLLVGCEGCRNDPDVRQQEEEQEAEKQDFSGLPPVPYPASSTIASGAIAPGAIASGAIKPGHWASAAVSIKANNYDARGDIENTAGIGGSSNQAGDWSLANRRPVVMPRGQSRTFSFRLRAPVPSSTADKRCFLRSRFVSSSRNTFFESGQQPYRLMASEEYSMVILTDRPERFAKFQNGNWKRPPSAGFTTTTNRRNYHLVIPGTDGILPLADTMLDWTSTAVIVWDDLSADALTPDQQTALTDWVHFGGRLIVNGADAADSLVGTKLESLLALVPRSNITLDPEAAQELLRGWAVKSDTSVSKQSQLAASQERIAVDGFLAEDARELANTGSLVLGRSIGRGQVIQPRFDLTSQWITDWNSYDSFVNGVLLGRPKRAYQANPTEATVTESYPTLQRTSADAAINTGLRLLSRDALLAPVADLQDSVAENSSKSVSQVANRSERIDPIMGLGGWNDNSDFVQQCRSMLRDESGIEIPKSDLVVKALGIYLLILVPVNYLVFRLMKRLEYAWLAVPVIAITGAIIIARAARLDIGFARSQNEIAVLELQPNYSRGHLTRILAIYNSLSSRYDVDFKTIDGCALPISDELTGGVFKTSYNEGPSLSGVAIGSNRVGMLHMEQVLDVGGDIELDRSGRIVNRTDFELSDVFVVDENISGETQIASVGGLGSGQTTQLKFKNSRSISIPSGLPMRVDQLMRRLASPGNVPRGSVRLVGRIDGPMEGLAVSPESNQQMSQTIVVAHLRYPVPESAQIDDNLMPRIADLPPEPEPIAP